MVLWQQKGSMPQLPKAAADEKENLNRRKDSTSLAAAFLFVSVIASASEAISVLFRLPRRLHSSQ